MRPSFTALACLSSALLLLACGGDDFHSDPNECTGTSMGGQCSTGGSGGTSNGGASNGGTAGHLSNAGGTTGTPGGSGGSGGTSAEGGTDGGQGGHAGTSDGHGGHAGTSGGQAGAVAGGGGQGGGGAGGSVSTTPTTIVAGISLTEFTVNNENVYWTTSDGSIMTAPAVTGASARPIAAGQSTASNLIADATDVFWSTNGQPDQSGSLLSAPIAGGTPKTLINNIYYVYHPVADSDRIYWTDLSNPNTVPDALHSITKEGTDFKTLTSAQYNGYFGGITVDDTFLYWNSFDTSKGAATLFTMMKDGSAPPAILTTVPTSPVNAGGTVLDGQSIYWSIENDLHRFDKSSATDTNLIPLPLSDYYLIEYVVGHDAIYLRYGQPDTQTFEIINDKIIRYTKGTLTKTTLVTNDDGSQFGGLAVDEQALYWSTTNNGSSAIWHIAK